MTLTYRHRIAALGLVLSVAGCASAPLVPPPALEGEHALLIDVTNVVCCEGVLRIAVYHDSEYWLRDDGMVRGRIGFITGVSQRVEVHGLPAGTYAIAVHQDMNGDAKLNRWLGILPREPYGFSNNVGRFGPASFNDASVTLDSDKSIEIALNPGVGSAP
ncbi:MAG: DUF2141 domain-containing protein [Pseudomonadota bacterium]